MAEERTAPDFLAPVSFEWDERKNLLNRAKHGVDFEDAVEVFYGPIIFRQSN
ncbi:MAG: Ribonuclease toxin, BrnT, of type toxin-antitoxin system, partial [Rhodospirillaceae bacterium]|nr:Ribonuclease toxin, BrnT, of type toxin-antitoxin system [Rhodospirillaceae bacterium]